MTKLVARERVGVSRSPVDDTGDRPRHVALHMARAPARHRTTGHAAEMAFFAVLTLGPSTIAVGSALGFSERVIGPEAVNQAENASIRGIRAVIGPELTDSAIAPFVHAQLSQPRGGVAL